MGAEGLTVKRTEVLANDLKRPAPHSYSLDPLFVVMPVVIRCNIKTLKSRSWTKYQIQIKQAPSSRHRIVITRSAEQPTNVAISVSYKTRSLFNVVYLKGLRDVESYAFKMLH